MSCTTATKLPQQSRGAALLLTLLVLTLAGLGLLVGELSVRATRTAADRQTRTVLALARDALLGRSVTDDNRPGALPCPALDDSGQVPLFIGSHCPAYVGRFPWKALKTGELRDGHGQLLWYAISPTLRDNPAAEPVNSQTGAGLRIGDQAEVAAIVIAPGPALAGQARHPGDSIADYLDGTNADGDYAFAADQPSTGFNDQLLPITRGTLFGLVGKRVLAEFRGADDRAPLLPAHGLRRYYNDFGTFPWADSDGDGRANPDATNGRIADGELSLPDWLRKNHWPALVSYRRSDAAAVHLGIGTATLDVIPCPALPCR